MTLTEKLNALVRFFIYLSIVMMLLKGKVVYIFFGLIAMVVSAVIVSVAETQQRQAEKFLAKNDLTVVDNKVCVKSTVDNPFMNPTITDIMDNPNRPSACTLDNTQVQEEIEKNFNARLYRSVGDIYDRESSQREFYTVPSTTIPNDQTGFAEWCYGTGATCKEGNGMQCHRNVFRTIGS